MVKVWTLDNEKAVLIINGQYVKGIVEYFRGKLTIKAENGQYYTSKDLA